MEIYNKYSTHHEFKYHCDHCEFQAVEKESLEEHYKAFHENRFSCSKCLQPFTEEEILKIHIQTEHDRIMYPCHLCDYESRKQDILNRHIKLHHNVQKQQNELIFAFSEHFTALLVLKVVGIG